MTQKEMKCENANGCLDPFACACLGGCRYPWISSGAQSLSGMNAVESALDGIFRERDDNDG